MDPFVLTTAGLALALATLLFVALRRRRSDPTVAALDARLARMEADSRETTRAAVALAERTLHLAQAYRDLETLKNRTDQLPDRMAQLARMDRRLEDLHGVFRTTTGRGAAGEDAVRAVLARFPDDAWCEKPALPSGIPDFGVRLPNGLLVPIDSKTGGADDVRRFLAASQARETSADDPERQRIDHTIQDLRRTIDERVRRSGRELAKYIVPGARTTPFVVQALPDAVFDAVAAPTRQDAADHGVILVPYALLHAFISTVRRLEAHGELDVARVSAALVKVRDAAGRIEETVRNSVERAATMATNAAQNIRRELDAIHAALLGAEAGVPGEPRPPVLRALP